MSIFPFIAIILLSFGMIASEATPQRNKACTREYNPVCGRLRRPNGRILQCTFSNLCVLRVHRRQTRQPWVGSPKACPKVSPGCLKAVRGY